MKKITALFLFVVLFGCGNTAVEKPDRLIEEDRMVDIIYDLSLLDAMRSQKPYELGKQHINPNTYIYEKYKIDSVQFARSNRYYASQIELYKTMYDRVGKRLKRKLSELDSVQSKPIKNPSKNKMANGIIR